MGGENTAGATIYFGQIDTNLYMNQENLKTTEQNQKYIHTEISYDAANNSALFKYNDNNYYPHAISIVKIGNNEILLVVETRTERTSTNDILYLCVKLIGGSNESSISKYIDIANQQSSVSNLVVFSSSDLFGGVDKTEVKGKIISSPNSGKIFTCLLESPVDVLQSSFNKLANLTTMTNYGVLFYNIHLDMTLATNVYLKRSTLQTIMDCQPATGDDMKNMENVNANGIISRETLFSNTLVLLTVLGLLLGTYVMIFEDIFKFLIVDFMKTEDTGLLSKDGKMSMNFTILYWYVVFISIAITLIISSLTNHVSHHMVAGLVLIIFIFLSNYLYRYRISDNLRLTIGESPNLLTAIQNFINVNERYMKYLKILFIVISFFLYIYCYYNILSHTEIGILEMALILYFLCMAVCYYISTSNPLTMLVLFAIGLIFIFLMLMRLFF